MELDPSVASDPAGPAPPDASQAAQAHDPVGSGEQPAESLVHWFLDYIAVLRPTGTISATCLATCGPVTLLIRVQCGGSWAGAYCARIKGVTGPQAARHVDGNCACLPQRHDVVEEPVDQGLRRLLARPHRDRPHRDRPDRDECLRGLAASCGAGPAA